MTESQWLDYDDPRVMLRFLGGQLTDRKVRLFLCACCRQIWSRIDDPRGHEVVEVAERYADGKAGADERLRATVAAARDRHGGDSRARGLAWATGRGNVRRYLEVILGQDPAPDRCVLLREVAGNPFRPCTVNPVWLGWNDRCVPKIAASIYEERAFGRMPILHDALLDASCDDEELLTHLRSREPHVLGCWALDLLLGKA
jgi:hypothetical protein